MCDDINAKCKYSTHLKYIVLYCPMYIVKETRLETYITRECYYKAYTVYQI